MKAIVITACLAVCFIAIGLLAFRAIVPRSNFSGHDQPGAWDGDYADVPFPAVNTQGAERVEEWRKLSNGACAANGVKIMALQFQTKATPEAVAKAYARWAHEPAVYDACLRGLTG